MNTDMKATSPRATGSPKKALGSWGATDFKKVATVNVKGGQEKYSGQKSDMNLSQHGGEGATLSTKTDMGLLNPEKQPKYSGPGRSL